jgi:hypothetical protein
MPLVAASEPCTNICPALSFKIQNYVLQDSPPSDSAPPVRPGFGRDMREEECANQNRENTGGRSGIFIFIGCNPLKSLDSKK